MGHKMNDCKYCKGEGIVWLKEKSETGFYFQGKRIGFNYQNIPFLCYCPAQSKAERIVDVVEMVNELRVIKKIKSKPDFPVLNQRILQNYEFQYVWESDGTKEMLQRILAYDPETKETKQLDFDDTPF